MKRFILLIMVLFTGKSIFSQTESTLIHLTKVDLNDQVLAQNFGKYEVFERPDLSGAFGNLVELQLKFGDENPLVLSVNRTRIFDEQAKIMVAAADGERMEHLTAPLTYSGTEQSTGNACALTIEESFFCGFIENETGGIYWEPLFRLIPDAPRNLILFYHAKDILPKANAKCLVGDAQKVNEEAKNEIANNPENMMMGCYEIEFAQAADYSMWQKYGGSTGLATYLASVMNLVQVNYDDEFSNSLIFKITGSWFSSCPTCDPWTNSTDPDALLASFSTWASASNGPFSNVPHDLGELWTNRTMNGFVGWASVGVACWNNFKYHWVQDHSTDINQVRSTVSHEIGHNLNAAHDPAGSTNIMNSCACGFSTWSQQSINSINAHVQDRINTGCFNACVLPCPPSISFAKTYGGSGPDAAQTVIQTSDGGYALVGNTYSSNGNVTGYHGAIDYWVVKTDAAGSIQWQKALGGGSFDIGKTIIQVSDGGYIVAGYTLSNDGDVSGNHGSNDIWIVKLSTSGSILWKKTVGGSNNDLAISMVSTNDGGFVIAGESASNNGDISGNHGASDYLAIKFNSVGSIVWQKCYGGSSFETARSIQPTSDGGFILNGESSSNNGDVSGNHGGSDFWVIKINSSGSLIWQKSLGGSADDYGRSAQQTLDGGYICSGYSWSNNGDVSGNHGDSDAWVVKLGNVGLIQWQKAFGGTGYEESNHVLQSSDGGFIVTCGTYSNNGDVLTNHGSSDYFILKIRPSGGILWQKSLGGGLGEVAYSSLITSDAGIVTVGFASSYDGDVTGNHGDQDFWMVKLVNSPNVTLTMNSTPTCSGVNNGTASATPSGGTGPYTYLWSNGQSTATATNLATGNYTVTVVATIGCTATAAVTVAGLPPLNISISMQTPACSSSSGSATVTASNGATPYTYKWSNNQTTATATNLAAGTYTVTVTDNNGCSATATATVASGTPPTLSISQTSPSCNTPANGSATVSASGGTTPYTYLWSNGQSTATASNLVQGTYTVTVTGGNGCTKTITATISQATALSLSATNTIAACGNLANGSITVAATGGSGPFSYAWSNGASGATVANLSAGSYTVTATAPGSCSATLTVPLSSVSAPVANFNATLNLLAASFSNSSQNANSYYWTFGDGGSSLLASPSHTYALPGNYQVCLTASSSCGSSTSCTGVSVSSTVATPLVIETGLTPATIVQTLFGNGCINVSNVTFSGNAAQIARFSGGSTNIGINNGIVLSSGRAVDAVGPNNSNGGGSGTGGSMTDADISAVNGGNSIHDLAVLEFDFVAAAPNIQFDFVFASEDYCEFIDDQYPDRFLLLVNGPGISGTFSSSSANYGLIPNTNTLVNANTINHLTNSTYYINNLINPVNTCLLTPAFGVAPSEIQFDGFTKKIKTNIPFQLGQTYHVKLKIADSGDSAYDAAVFLQAGQYSSSTVSLATPAGLSSVASGSTAVYSVPAVPDILSYTWTPPPGCSINGNPIGQAVTLPAATGASVTVTFGCGWGDLCVQANGNCIQSAPSCKSINYFGFVYSGLPLCNAATPGGDDLQSTCVYTNLNGLTGTTQGYTADAGPIGFCSQVQNGVWYGFVANSSTMTFVLTPTSTASAQGLQLALTDRAGNSLACDMGGANYYPNANVVSASNLILGEVYFLFIDGYAGDECNFTISSTPSNNGFSLPALGAINTLQGPSNTCPGSSVVLSVPAVANAIQYTWQASSGTLINGELPPLVLGATGHTVTVTVANNNSTISVRASNGCQESNISSKTIQVAALPPTILPAVTICNYDLPYNTPWGDEVYGTGLYQGILPSYNGCDSIVQQQVFVKLPIFTHLGNISICKGEVYNFCGENLTESGFNVCTFTSWQGCDSLVDFTLLVLDPTTEITGSTVICANGSTTLYGGIYSPHTFSKIWRDLNGQVVGSGVMLNVTMPGTYILTTIEGGLGLQCIEHDTVVVTQVNAQPPTVTAFGGNLDCTTTELTIGASSPNQGLQYQWSGPNNFMANQQFVNVSDGGLYLLVVTDQNGCTASSSAVVSKTGFPIDLQIIVDPSGVGCQATATPLGGVPPYTYYWTNNQTTQTASNLPSGVFVVTVSDANNCTATQTANCSAVSTFDLAGLEFFTVKPNPASTYLFVELLLAQPERVQIRLINAWGQVLFESSRQANEIHEQIDLANIAAGCYFLQVSTASGSKWEVISIVR